MHPQFIESIANIPHLLEALTSTDPVSSIRLNPRKLHTGDGGTEVVPWCEFGRYLLERPKFTLDPAMHQGCYYVQDASSMFIAYAIRQICPTDSAPLKYLDACAAPGGKTTAAIDALPDGSLIVANEFDPRRAQILSENVAKWGYPNAVITRGDTSQFRKLKGEFDIVAVDAPCSGEGMMRKDAVAVEQWTPELVVQCAERQREILDNVIPSLRSDGYLVYSTCTFNRTENEDIIDWLTENYPFDVVDIYIDPSWGIVTTPQGYHFYPSNLKGEGLFLSVLRLRDGAVDDSRKKVSAPKGEKKHPLQSWIADSDRFVIEETGDQVIAIPIAYYGDIMRYRKALNIVSQGILLAVKKGRDFIPTQQLALSTTLNISEFNTVEVNLDTSLSYLRREAQQLPPDTPRGIVLLTYEGWPLGWVKNLGNRANNLYPDAWRIRH
ncbi:MAG: rRNA cytosine-C5-methyltransferase [Muribaculaceae bacterium]|nr:rRNA cytosine-C5-methyltransferase [Muribaculaceae bacterium]